METSTDSLWVLWNIWPICEYILYKNYFFTNVFLNVSNNTYKKTYIQFLEENFNIIGEKLQPFVWYQTTPWWKYGQHQLWWEPHSKLQQLNPLKRSLKKLSKDLQREEEHLHFRCMVDVIKIFIKTGWLQTTMGTRPALLSGCWTVDKAKYWFGPQVQGPDSKPLFWCQPANGGSCHVTWPSPQRSWQNMDEARSWEDKQWHRPWRWSSRYKVNEERIYLYLLRLFHRLNLCPTGYDSWENLRIWADSIPFVLVKQRRSENNQG